MRRRHRMPFGAEIVGGGVRFRLWAPTAARVALEVDESGPLAMDRDVDGWCELYLPGIGHGARYRFRIDDRLWVPDPASRSQPDGPHAASEVIDPDRFEWHDDDWRGRPWHELVIYELHVGTFTPEGTFLAAIERLPHLVELGVTAIELMPLSSTPGGYNWGYDGVYHFAPSAPYGRPEDLKRLIEAAHHQGIAVLLDVVYNHFGPEGNYLHAYAERFFTDRYETPWGAALDFESPGNQPVRDFFGHNAQYWLEEYRFDGLRLDAVDQIRDASPRHILAELAHRVRRGVRDRHIHLVLENDHNAPEWLAPRGAYDAQWNDDLHHGLHVLLTGERDGYYRDYASDTLQHVGRCLAEGFAYQGEVSAHRGGRRRGAPSGDLPSTAFVTFLQNHDQIGNRALGERIHALAGEHAVRAASAIYLLAPSIPLLFMGEEWAASSPFLFFCDFEPGLAEAVREGRQREFASFMAFAGAALPDPLARESFVASKLRWDELSAPAHRRWLDHYRALIDVRHREIVPRLPRVESGSFEIGDGDALTVRWPIHGEGALRLLANPRGTRAIAPPLAGRSLYATHPDARLELPPWYAAWALES